MTNNNEKKLAVVGLGYVGLPLAVLASEKGWQVTGIDIDQNKINLINSGSVPFEDKVLQRQLKKYSIKAESNYSVVSNQDVIVIAVPTPVDKKNKPDLTPLTSALSSLLQYLRAGQLLIIESTINPGVMEEIVMPLLRKRLDINIDSQKTDKKSIYVAHCPERINPGDSKWNVRNIPRVLGGFSKAGVKKAEKFYTSILEAPIKILDSATEAEAVKILENTFRDINIAYINEMARSFDALGINISNVIAGATTKPFAFMAHYPGNGVGGHCISVDPYYMIARGKEAGFNHQFLKLARKINNDMPAYTVKLLELELAKLNKNIKSVNIALLGLSYKKEVGDTRNSPALKTLEILKLKLARVKTYDPYVPDLSTLKSLDESLNFADVIILGCDHHALVNKLTAKKLKKHNIKIVIDAKNALHKNQIKSQSIAYHGIGRS